MSATDAVGVDDPIPEAVREARHVHVIPPLGGDAYQRQEIQERAFWLGMRQIIREEMAELRNAPTSVDPKMEDALDAIKSSIADAQKLQKTDPDDGEDQDDKDVSKFLDDALDAISQAIDCQSKDSEEEDDDDEDDEDDDDDEEKGQHLAGTERTWPSPHSPWRPWSISSPR